MKLQRPPGPRDRIFGLSILRNIYRDVLGFYEKAHKEFGDTIYFPLFNIDEYVFTDPEMIREVLVEHAKSFIRYERQAEVFRPVHGNSILISEGSEWQRQRRMLQPEFSPKRFGEYAQQVTLATALALDNLHVTNDRTVDFQHLMNMLTMDAIMRTMFSSSDQDESIVVEQALRDLSQLAYQEMFMPFSPPDWLPLPSIRKRKRHVANLERIIGRFVAQRRADPKPHHDLLDMLLNTSDPEGNGDRLSDKELRDQCMTIFLAGHETTSTGLTWVGWNLASHPDIAQRAAAEVDAVLGGRVPTFADLPKLEYLGQIIKETLRLYSPAAGMFMRRAIADVQIGPWLVPKGSLVGIYSLLVHRDARWFPDPLRFDPERFNAENAKTIPRGAYFPFGNGPRVCIGNSFATMEMTLILAMLLQRFTLEPGPGQHQPGLHLTVILHPLGGLKLTLRPRPLLDPTQTVLSTDLQAPQACPFHAHGAT